MRNEILLRSVTLIADFDILANLSTFSSETLKSYFWICNLFSFKWVILFFKFSVSFEDFVQNWKWMVENEHTHTHI